MPAQTEIKTTSAYHEIKITLDGQHAVLSACPAMDIGDTVRYVTHNGEVKVVFVDAVTQQPASPFEETEIIGSALQTVTNRGTFEVRCFVKPRGGSDFWGWDEKTSPQSGGQFPVPPNRP